ncbi:MAG: diphthamide biosynthesis enzyme Dph2 [Thermoproteota archaeon]|nr:diphthamide biosynthesis enzyme Dph2 [Thermoproteota archaeon]
METAIYNLEENRLREEIIKRKAKRVLIQLPEGLKREGPHLATFVEKTGALAVVSADPCYGACDLATSEAESLNADLIVHYGHTEMMKREGVSAIYIEARANIDVEDAVRKAIPCLKNWERVGLTTTVQHIHQINKARELLLEAGKIVTIGDLGRVKYAGQVIGCNFSNAKSISKDVDAFLFVGGGRFHGLGVALATMKPTIIADPYGKRAFSLEGEAKKILKQRWANISEAKKAKNFGVLIGLKTGQQRLGEAIRIKEKFEKMGRNALLLALKEITPQALMEFPTIDAFVNTACPRLALDNVSKFRRPFINWNEALVVLGEMNWEELWEKGWFENYT